MPPKTGGESWISCMYSWDNTCVTKILKNVCPFLERSLMNLIWYGEFPIDNCGLFLIRLDETVRRLLVRTGLNEYELAVNSILQVREDQKTKWLNLYFIVGQFLWRAGKSFKTYRLVPIFRAAIFEIVKYETVRRLLVRIGLNEYELAVKLVQLVHLNP